METGQTITVTGQIIIWPSKLLLQLAASKLLSLPYTLCVCVCVCVCLCVCAYASVRACVLAFVCAVGCSWPHWRCQHFMVCGLGWCTWSSAWTLSSSHQVTLIDKTLSDCQVTLTDSQVTVNKLVFYAQSLLPYVWYAWRKKLQSRLCSSKPDFIKANQTSLKQATLH